jgi:peptidoglycan/xylan/chitin deacetylase (PgdA/CDA1 family)
LFYIAILIIGTAAFIAFVLFTALMTCAHVVGAVFLFLFLGWFSLSIFLVQTPFFFAARIRGDKKRPRVALTFDDGPHPKFTSMVLDILKRRGARATFFLVGEKVLEQREITTRIVREGHDVGNHSMSHPHLLSLKRKREQVREMEGCDEAIQRTTGVSPVWYRPPMGYKTPSTFCAAKRLGLNVVGWEIKGWDTVYRDPKKIASSILNRVKRGSIILLHDSSSLKGKSTDRSPTVDALPIILSGLKKMGLEPVTLTELFDMSGGKK